MGTATDLIARLLGPNAAVRETARPEGFQGELLVVDALDAAGATRLLLSVDPAGRVVQHSAMRLAEPDRLTAGYEQLAAVAILIAAGGGAWPGDALLLGLGGAALWRHLRRVHPGCRITAVERWPVVVDIARRWFHFDGDAVIADAVDHMARTSAAHDLIVVDLYDAAGLAALPDRFWTDCRARLGASGVVTVNWADFAGDDHGRASAAAVAARFADTLYLTPASRENNCLQLSARRALPRIEDLRHGVQGPPTLGGRRIALDNLVLSRDWPRPVGG